MIFKLKTNEICKLIDVDLTNLGEGGGKCSKSFTKYGGVKELESLMVSELNAYVVNFPPHVQSLHATFSVYVTKLLHY